MKSTEYTNEFYARIAPGSLSSARIVLRKLSALSKFDSLIDIGCGAGTWLQAAKELGILTAVGLDGSWARDRNVALGNEFVECQLADLNSYPNFGRNFDLAICLEVAEHLPASVAERFVRYISSLSDTVLFSAAIPFQGGDGHINERWPAYWYEYFKGCGYECVDVLRWSLWHEPDVEWWYRQNILIFSRRSDVIEAVRKSGAGSVGLPLAVIHPDNFLRLISSDNKLKRLIKKLVIFGRW
jgi:SAM-dependent methyltransferase